jgi:hypothetical protein
VLALSKKQCARRATELAQVAKNEELEVLLRSQAEKITKLEMAYAALKCDMDNVTTGYQRMVAKHDAFAERAKKEKAKLTDSHVAELAKLRGDLELETRSYTKYRQTVASSFDEVKAQCLPFPNKGAKVEEMID